MGKSPKRVGVILQKVVTALRLYYRDGKSSQAPETIRLQNQESRPKTKTEKNCGPCNIMQSSSSTQEVKAELYFAVIFVGEFGGNLSSGLRKTGFGG